MDKDLLLKDGLLYFGAIILPAAGSLLLASGEITGGLVIYGMAMITLIARTVLKNKEVQPKKK